MKTVILLLLSAVAALCLYDMLGDGEHSLAAILVAKDQANRHHEERAYDEDGRGYVVQPKSKDSPESAKARDFLSLENTDGRFIRAKVLSLAGDMVKIEREDGMLYEFSISLLTPSSHRKVLAAMGMGLSRVVTLPGTDTEVAIDVPLAKNTDSSVDGRTVTRIDGPRAEIGMRGATYIPGLSSVDVVDLLRREGFAVSNEGDEGVTRWSCTLSKSLINFQAGILTDSMRMASVHTLDLRVNSSNLELLEKEAIHLMHVIGVCPLKNTDQTAFVTDWITKNNGRNATLRVGSLRYEFYSSEQGRSLMITVR